MYSNETFGIKVFEYKLYFVEHKPLENLPLDGSYVAIT